MLRYTTAIHLPRRRHEPWSGDLGRFLHRRSVEHLEALLPLLKDQGTSLVSVLASEAVSPAVLPHWRATSLAALTVLLQSLTQTAPDDVTTVSTASGAFLAAKLLQVRQRKRASFFWGGGRREREPVG